MAFIAFHMLLITLFLTVFDKIVWKEFSLKQLFDNLLNGIANIYFPNKINQYATSGKNDRQHVKSLHFGQLMLMEIIIMIENVFMLVAVLVKFWNNTLAIGLIAGSFGCYLLGLGLKMLYYNFFHIWKDVLWTDLSQLKSEINAIRQNNQDTQVPELRSSLVEEETNC